MLMGDEEARHGERCENNLLFVLRDQFLSSESLHYDASALIKQGCVRFGEKYSVYLNPFAPQRLVVCDEKLRYLGTAHLQDRIPWLEKEAAAVQIAKAKRAEAPSLENLARRGAAQNRRMIEMRENNAAVVTGKSLSCNL